MTTEAKIRELLEQCERVTWAMARTAAELQELAQKAADLAAEVV